MRNQAIFVLLSYILVLVVALSAAVMQKPAGVLFFGLVVIGGLAVTFLLPRASSRKQPRESER